MKILLISTFIASVVFLLIDIIWLNYSVKNFYKPNIGHLLLDKPVIWAAVLFYLIYVLGMAIVVINPSIEPYSLLKVTYTGFIFGLVAYGTYNLTNMATVKGWSPSVVLVDMIWGGSLTAFSSFTGLLIAKKFFSS
tara:strand:+ start:92 stop:499 length:408 start_codon:yes stop_codon:yes gene_type:complete